jgi:UrcA family protein
LIVQTYFIPRPVPALFFASALGLIFAGSSAAAQDYGRYGDQPRTYQGEPVETVIVPAPRYYEPNYYREERGRLNGDIVNVSLSSEVRFDDLDLRTRWGVDELRSRIRLSARDVCDQLERRYPVAADNSPPCYREAVEDAMDQADAAIARARGYAEADWRR